MEIPVYLFTGFLESGKTHFIKETLADPNFFEDRSDRTLVILTEEGEEEIYPAELASKEIYLEIIDDEKRINPDKLEALRRKYRATRVLLEYNGMKPISDIIDALPEGWFIFQEVMTVDSETIDVFNANMRNLVVDKLQGCDLVLFNRCDGTTDRMALHKLVRAVSRRAQIIYESTDGAVAFDDIEDPLPFDVNAPVINIEDRDYALFYRELSENTDSFDGKTVTFLGQVRKDGRPLGSGFLIGRPIMTCCVQDITFGGLFCEDGGDKFQDGDWVRITAPMTVKYCRIYGRPGPVLKLGQAEKTDAPKDPVATFY